MAVPGYLEKLQSRNKDMDYYYPALAQTQVLYIHFLQLYYKHTSTWPRRVTYILNITKHTNASPIMDIDTKTHLAKKFNLYGSNDDIIPHKAWSTILDHDYPECREHRE